MSEPAEITSDETCPWCGYEFMELYLKFNSDDASFNCPQCDKPIAGTRDIIFYLKPVKTG